MKQVIIAVILLAAVLAIGIISCIFTASLDRDIGAGLESARTEMRNGNWERAERDISAASARWARSKPALGLLAGDAELAATDAAMAAVESALEHRDKSELDMRIRLAVLMIQGIRERESISWHNLG